MVSHWLGQNSANEITLFAEQVAKAEWLEKRYFESMKRIMGDGK